MTKDMIRAEMQKQFGEYFDAYVLVGKVAGRNEFVVVAQGADPQINRSIIAGMMGVMACSELATTAKTGH